MACRLQPTVATRYFFNSILQKLDCGIFSTKFPPQLVNAETNIGGLSRTPGAFASSLLEREVNRTVFPRSGSVTRPNNHHVSLRLLPKESSTSEPKVNSWWHHEVVTLHISRSRLTTPRSKLFEYAIIWHYVHAHHPTSYTKPEFSEQNIPRLSYPYSEKRESEIRRFSIAHVYVHRHTWHLVRILNKVCMYFPSVVSHGQLSRSSNKLLDLRLNWREIIVVIAPGVRSRVLLVVNTIQRRCVPVRHGLAFATLLAYTFVGKTNSLRDIMYPFDVGGLRNRQQLRRILTCATTFATRT